MAKPASGTPLDSGSSFHTGLLHVWPFNEGTGTTASDIKGTNHITLSSSGLWTTNGNGPILRNAASSRPCALGSQVAFDGATDFTIAIRALLAANDDNGMVCGDIDAADMYMWMRGGNYFAINVGGTLSTFNGITSFTAMHDIVVTYTFINGVSQLFRVYVDGSLINSAASSSGAFVFDSLMAGFSGGLAQVGDLELFSVWSGRALTAGEVATYSADPYAALFGAGGGATPVPVFINQYRQRWN